MIDTWLKSDQKTVVIELQKKHPNTIGVAEGHDSIAAQTLVDGTVVLAQAAAGDPTKYYLCIRDENPVAPPQGASLIEASEGAAVLGVWA